MKTLFISIVASFHIALIFPQLLGSKVRISNSAIEVYWPRRGLHAAEQLWLLGHRPTGATAPRAHADGRYSGVARCKGVRQLSTTDTKIHEPIVENEYKNRFIQMKYKPTIINNHVVSKAV